MAGASIYIDVDDKRVLASLRHAATQLDGSGLTDLLERIGNRLLNSTRERAERQVGPDGIPWMALSDKYAKTKAGKRPGKRILEFDGHLLGDRLTTQVVGNELLIGTFAPYAATHQFGRGPIPARPYLGLSPEDVADVDETVRLHLRDAFDAG
ncbi:MAG TPA: phage virion morphogenesis protein [Rhodanobacteraceae bacterium]|nr:phage virion morphogenesis protein [Rhodanobacteraceae bacterium]